MSARRVLICEDSQTYAAGLARLLARDPEFEVVGVCESAEQAIARLPRLRPDVVTMDLELPRMSGMDAIEQIMGSFPVPILVLSGHVRSGSRSAVAALAAGALDVIPKAGLDLADLDSASAVALRQRLKVLSGVPVIRHPRARLTRRRPTARVASVIGICASTGGPPALAAVLASVPATFSIPLLVVQHIASGFLEGFAEWLDDQVPLPVRLAVAGAAAAPGIWVAPEGSHLVLDDARRFGLDEQPATRHRPSGDVLLHSLAATAGASAVAIVLTGMGRDGADGAAAVHAAGGLALAQDEATAAVFGMPRAAAERGAQLVPLDQIAAQLRALRPASAASA